MRYHCPRCNAPVAIVGGELERHHEPDPATLGCYPRAYPPSLRPVDGGEAVQLDAHLECPWSGAKARIG